ncbi:MAG: hypothetical protein D6772_15620 [Bacteroidetes bacterium]|nr:MAG: hypothetical protein D6772_15620 [Bacteroidota bacterium]
MTIAGITQENDFPFFLTKEWPAGFKPTAKLSIPKQKSGRGCLDGRPLAARWSIWDTPLVNFTALQHKLYGRLPKLKVVLLRICEMYHFFSFSSKVE